jgi:hypothetical protein
MKTYSESTFDNIRKVLQPRGELPLVKLSLRNHGYVDLQEISEAIDEMESLFPQVKAGIIEPTPLQKLAIRLLFDSIPK